MTTACYTSHMERPKPPSQSFNVRLPTALHEQVKALAAAEDRSLNGQIVHLLRYALAHYPGSPPGPASAARPHR